MGEVFKGVDRVVLRRQPKQDRSRGRVDDILKVAMQLIGEKGIDAVTMKEVAVRSGGPIASVYQYFPNKSAIIATLYETYAQGVGASIDDSMGRVRSAADLFTATEEIIGRYYETIRLNPALQDLLNAVQADKALQHLDIVETRKHVERFNAVTKPFIPEHMREQYGRVAFLMFQLAAATTRLALAHDDDEAKVMLSDYTMVIHDQIRHFLDGRQGCPDGRPSSAESGA